jgi:hypothetical protein
MLAAGMTSCLNDKPDGADGLSLASNAMMVAMDGFGIENSTTNAPMIMALVVGSLKFIYGPFKSFWNGREMRVWLACYLVVLDFHDQMTPMRDASPPTMMDMVPSSVMPWLTK